MKSRVVNLVLAAVVAMTGLSACADDSTAPRERSSASNTATPDQASTATASAEPAVQPTQGRELKLPTVSMRLTQEKRWRIVPVGNTWGATRRRLADFSQIIVSLSNILAVTDDLDLQAASTLKVKDKPWLRRVENRVIDGAECWVLDGRDDKVHLYMVGGFAGDREFTVEFTVPLSWTDGDLLIEQMLASVQVTDPLG